MTDPFETLNLWIEQQQKLADQDAGQHLARWRELISAAQTAAVSQNPTHAQLIKTICQQSEALHDLLNAVTSGSESMQIATLRHKLHQIHLDYLINHAEMPEQFIPLIYTQLVTPQGFDSAQIKAFEELLEQWELPQYKQLNGLMKALLKWLGHSQAMLEQLNRVAEQAIETWMARNSDQLEDSERIQLWAEIYDEQFRLGFEQDSMQNIQGALIDSLSELKLRWRELVEKLAEPLGLTTQRQIDTIVQSLDQQRRRIRALEREVSALRTSAKLTERD